MSNNQPLLEVAGLSKTFEGRRMLWRTEPHVRAVDDVSLRLSAGETLGLVGETGSGKSTLGRLVMRLIEPTIGSVLFDGEDLGTLSAREMRAARRQIQMVFQDPYGSLDPRSSVGDLLAEPLIVHGVPRTDIPRRVAEVMKRVGLDPSYAVRFPHQFSGGQRQRIGIARAIVLNPKLLILDEPVSALDVSIQAQILNLIADIQRERGLAMLFIAHDLAVVRHVSHRIAVMYLGRIVELGGRDEIFSRPMHPYTATLLSAVPIPDPVIARARKTVTPIGEIGSATALPSGCRFHPRCPKARLVATTKGMESVTIDGQAVARVCTSIDPTLDAWTVSHSAACHFPDHAPDALQ
jgi:oligopeptide transport system ATP-binding protein